MGKTFIRRGPAFPFFLEALESIESTIKPMFGCHAVYVNEKIVAILRDREDFLTDNGIWVALEKENIEAVKSIFPVLRDLKLFGGGPTQWQNLPKLSAEFELNALKLAEMIVKMDPRIGKAPMTKRRMVKKADADGASTSRFDDLEKDDEEQLQNQDSVAARPKKTEARPKKAVSSSKSTGTAKAAGGKSSTATTKTSVKTKSSAKVITKTAAAGTTKSKAATKPKANAKVKAKAKPSSMPKSKPKPKPKSKSKMAPKAKSKR